MFSFSGSGGVDKTERKNRERVFFWRECKMKMKKLKYKKKKKKTAFGGGGGQFCKATTEKKKGRGGSPLQKN